MTKFLPRDESAVLSCYLISPNHRQGKLILASVFPPRKATFVRSPPAPRRRKKGPTTPGALYKNPALFDTFFVGIAQVRALG